MTGEKKMIRAEGPLSGHLVMLITAVIWGTTFIATKILLQDFAPIEILFFRFIMGFAALWLICPHRLRIIEKKQELVFMGAGLTGITLYYLLENIALTYTMASNVGVAVSVSPFFTVILTYFFLRDEKLHWNFFIGFLFALAGIILINFNGSTRFHLNPMGDWLAVAAAFVWAVYAILTKKISGYGYSSIQSTRHVFFYGLVFMIPALFLFDFHWDLARFQQPVYLFNIIFLGLGASAACFVTWNFAVRCLGAVKTTIYIYLIPVVTVIASVLVLHETITGLACLGTLLTLAGLFISESDKLFHRKSAQKRKIKAEE